MSYLANILSEAEANEFFRKVIFTGAKSQLVLMNLKPGEDIGEETHQHVEQILFNASGSGKVMLDDKESEFKQGDVVIVTPGTKHNLINTGSDAMKLYTLYVPANHIDSTIHKTKEDTQKDLKDEEFGHQV